MLFVIWTWIGMGVLMLAGGFIIYDVMSDLNERCASQPTKKNCANDKHRGDAQVEKLVEEHNRLYGRETLGNHRS